MMAISLILLVLAFVAPWYHYVSTIPSSSPYTTLVYEDRFYVDNWQREITFPPWTATLDYHEDVGSWQAVGDVMLVEIVLLLAAVVVTAAAAAAVFVRGGQFGTVVCAIGAALLAAMVFYFYLMVPPAVAESVPGLYSVVQAEGFWGECEVSATTINWGPTVGWYLVIAATILESTALALISSGGVRGPQIY